MNEYSNSFQNWQSALKTLPREQVGTSSCCLKCSFVTRDLQSLIFMGTNQNCGLLFLLQPSGQSIYPVSLRLILLIFIGLDGPTAVLFMLDWPISAHCFIIYASLYLCNLHCSWPFSLLI